ncbi:hypothetical protein ACI2KR_06505 [Pseudomonas luteola]
MNLIANFSCEKDLTSFRDHVGKVLAQSLILPLKQRKLDEVVAQLVGAKDFNTALAMVNSKTDPSLATDTETSKHSGIHTFLLTDDHRFQVEFDSEPYFEHLLATNMLEQELAMLEACEFEGSDAADKVAYYFDCRVGYEEVTQVLSYLDLANVPNSEEDIGFSVRIKEYDVRDWLVRKAMQSK